MDILQNYLIELACVFILVVGVVVLSAWMSKSGGSRERIGEYKRRRIMTENEREFFGRLVAALPGHFIFPQVSMAALLTASSADRKAKHADRLRIAQQRVDFAICNSACKVIAVVELDDKTHNVEKDRTRDARLAQGGIRVLRFQSSDKPDIAAIAAAFTSPQVATGQTTSGVLVEASSY